MKKKEQKSAAELYEIQPEELVDISEQAFEDVRVSLEKVEAMKQTVAEGIIKAKEKGLKDHVEKLRALLRKLVVMENALKEEQNKKETAKMAFELDKLAAECNREISTKDEPATPVSNETKFVTVAMRYNVAAKLIGLGGVLACLLGCVIYLLLVQIDPVNIQFEWIWLLINALGMALFGAIGAALHQKSLDYMALAEEASEARRVEEEEKAQRVADEFAEIMAQAYALELEKEHEAKKPSNDEKKDDDANLVETSTHGKILSVKKVTQGNAEGVHVTVRGGSTVIIAAIAAGVAALAAFVFAKKPPKEKKEDQKVEKKTTNNPRIQGVFFQMPE